MSHLSGPEEDDTSGLSGTGLLVNIEPTTAQSTFHVKKGAVNGVQTVVGSHPLRLTNKMLSGSLTLDEQQPPPPSAVHKTITVRPFANTVTNGDQTSCWITS